MDSSNAPRPPRRSWIGLHRRRRTHIRAIARHLDHVASSEHSLRVLLLGNWGEGIREEDMVKLQWVKPKLVVEVAFVEWTRDGLLRHPKFVGIREDKKARDVIRETAPEEG